MIRHISNIIAIFLLLTLVCSCNSTPEDITHKVNYRYPQADSMQRAIAENGKIGYLNSKGEWAIAPQYTVAYDFSEGIAIVATTSQNDELAYKAISKQGKVLLDIPLNNCILDTEFSQGLLMFKEMKTGRCGYINLNGETKIYLPEDVVDSYRFSNGKAKFISKDRSGYIDMNGNIISTDISADKDTTHLIKASTVKKVNIIEQRNWSKIGQDHPLFIEAKKILDGNLKEEDARNRTLILNYTEHLRTSYTTKDIDFIEQVFSSDALIITGKFIKNSSQKELGMKNSSHAVYNIRSKQNYIKHLKRIFAANAKIDVKFSEFKIMRHPTIEGIYGVTLRQEYESSIYSDDGYLFLLWDFRNEAMPLIHVRTWQESNLGNNAVLEKDSIFGIRNFNLQ